MYSDSCRSTNDELFMNGGSRGEEMIPGSRRERKNDPPALSNKNQTVVHMAIFAVNTLAGQTLLG